MDAPLLRGPFPVAPLAALAAAPHNGGVELTATLDAPCSPEALFAEVESLDTYPEWLSIVPRAERDPDIDPDGAQAWLVELRGRIGPLARSKRLRMVRVACEPPRVVRFERRELDGRAHSPWVLDAEVTPLGAGEGSRLTMHLRYGGSFGGAMLERLLRDEVAASRPRLRARVLARATDDG